MPIFRRSDGDYLKSASPLRKMIPFLMQRRNESAVYFKQLLNLDKTLAYIEAKKRRS